MGHLLQRAAVLLFLCFTLIAPALAADEAASRAAWDAAAKASVNGPTDVPFDDQAVLGLPSGMAYIPVREATALMKLWGNSVGSQFRGLIVSRKDTEQWVISIDQTADGYVKDDEARDWNADELLQSLKDGTEAQNPERMKAGLPALDVVGWVEPPNYDAANHRLVWSLKAVHRDAAADAEATVNYNTYALGRDGYYEINLMTGANTVEQEKPMARGILSAFKYKTGKRYEDFKPETDHLAEYGIAALIGGVVAKKIGLLALAGVFFAKFAKIILIGGAVAGGAVLKMFRRNKTPAA